jgi:DNA-binding transcriptional regulator PaaX
MSAMRIPYGEILELLLDTAEVFSRRDCGWILAGYRLSPSERREIQVLERMQRRGWIQREGRGTRARYVVTADGRKTAGHFDPAACWRRAWDGKWRVFSYDLPESDRKGRSALWRALRERKLGLLQRSVWVWPHEVEPILNELIQAQGIPECFCGFEASRLFLCSDEEVVASAWDWEEINRRHDRYLRRVVATPADLRKAGSLASLGRLARLEREAYHDAFRLDPLLPRSMRFQKYKGEEVEHQHRRFREELRSALKSI